MNSAMSDAGGSSLSFENVFLEPATMNDKEVAPSFIGRTLAPNTITKASEVIAGTNVETDTNATEQKLMQPSKCVVKPALDTRSEIERELGVLCVVAKTDVETIAKTRLTK